MKKFVCESLNSFLRLNENMKTAEDLLTSEEYKKLQLEDKSLPTWEQFKEIVSGSGYEGFAERFAEWIKNGEDFETFKELMDQAKELKIKIEDPQKLSFSKFQKNTDQKIKEEKEKTVSETPKNINIPFTRDQRKKDPTVFGHNLWVYGVLIKTRNHTYVKFGDTRNEKYEGAVKYAGDQTIGKARGIVGEDIEELNDYEIPKDIDNDSDVKVIFCENVTDYALSINKDFIRGDRKGFDNFMRPMMPGKRKVLKNKRGGVSLELHEEDKNQSDKDIKEKWLKAINDLKTGKDTPLKKPYEARKFHEEMNVKISSKQSDKHLLGAATGAGKEVITLATLIFINDERKDLFDSNTIHVSCATIPQTELELFEELSRVSGINIKGKLVDFSRIEPYCTRSFADGYQDGLTPDALKWFNGNVTVVDKIKDIPSHSGDEVPVLFGSFQDIGLKSSQGDKTKRYEELGDRIGILSIGEGHQFLSNAENKLWSSIKEKYKFKFLLLITGTPYDFIFNESGHLYFSPEERTLFTRSDLYEAKREGDKDFQKYPAFNYYSLNLAEEIRKIKEEEGEDWKEEEGFTYEKLFEKKDGKFKYQELIISFFKRLFSVNKKGSPDQLSILEAKDLCEEAKKHVLIALPTGTKDSPAGEYITDLKNLLEENGALGNYTAIAAYEDDLGEIKEKVDEEKGKTVTFTCRKLLTGTNIPKWGSLVFLRPIGSSIKFFEQATGRIGRPSKGKTNVGVFLGNIDNIVSLHVSADEKILANRGENQEYNYIIKRTYDNYNFFGVKEGKWEKLDMPNLVEAVERASMNTDYGINLCLNNPKAPKDFDQIFKAPSSGGKETVEVTSQGNQGAKNKRTEERTTQLALQFEEAKDKEKWWKDMIKIHIPKIVMICLLRNISTIQEFEKEIKRALNENDEDFLNMLGEGVDMIPLYIGDDNQIDRAFLNRWIDKNKSLSSDKEGIEGFKKRYEVINKKMDMKKLSESIVFDPLELTKEICEKIKDPLKKAERIMIIEKNGSFTYSILNHIGFENAKRLTLIVLEPLSNEIIKYIFSKNKELPEIIFIKDINEIQNMPKFDIIVGNPPYQGKKLGGGAGSGNAIWQKFVESCFSILKNQGYLCFIHPIDWRVSIGKKKIQKAQNILMENQLIYLKLATTPFKGIGAMVDWYVLEKREKYKETEIDFIDSKEKFFLDKDKFPLYSYNNENVKNILKKVLTVKDNGLISRKSFGGLRVYDESKPKGKYKQAHGSGFTKNEWKYSEYPHIDQFKTKVIMSAVRKLRPIYDKGEIGIGDHVHYILVNNEKEANFLISILNSKLGTFLQKIFCTGFWDGDSSYWNSTYPIKKIRIDEAVLKSDKDIYEYFDLTPAEIKYIESQL